MVTQTHAYYNIYILYTYTQTPSFKNTYIHTNKYIHNIKILNITFFSNPVELLLKGYLHAAAVLQACNPRTWEMKAKGSFH